MVASAVPLSSSDVSSRKSAQYLVLPLRIVISFDTVTISVPTFVDLLYPHIILNRLSRCSSLARLLCCLLPSLLSHLLLLIYQRVL